VIGLGDVPSRAPNHRPQPTVPGASAEPDRSAVLETGSVPGGLL
jgi:hypothetical protein